MTMFGKFLNKLADSFILWRHLDESVGHDAYSVVQLAYNIAHIRQHLCTIVRHLRAESVEAGGVTFESDSDLVKLAIEGVLGANEDAQLLNAASNHKSLPHCSIEVTCGH